MKLENLDNELKVLRNTKNSNIIKFFEFHETDNSFYLVFQYIKTKTLTETSITNNNKDLIRIIITSLFNIGLYLEKKGIIHKNLNPDSFIWKFSDIGNPLNELVLYNLDFCC